MRKRCSLLVLPVAVILYVFCFHKFKYKSNLNLDDNVNFKRLQDVKLYQQTMRKYAKDNYIIISMTDYYFLDLALNFHYCLEKLKITHYIFVCMHDLACEELKRRKIQ